jgi:hypothetical protein
MIGSSAKLRPGGRPFSRLVYRARIDSGSEMITIGVLKPMNLTLNASPWRRRLESRNSIGRNSQRAVWIAGGALGPGGRLIGRKVPATNP